MQAESHYEWLLWQTVTPEQVLSLCAKEIGEHTGMRLLGLHEVPDEHGKVRPVYLVLVGQMVLGKPLERTLLVWFEREGDEYNLAAYEPSPGVVRLCKPLANLVKGWLQGGDPVRDGEPCKFDASHGRGGAVGGRERHADAVNLLADSRVPLPKRRGNIAVCHTTREQGKDATLVGGEMRETRVGRQGGSVLGDRIREVRHHVGGLLLRCGFGLLGQINTKRDGREMRA